MKHTQTFLVTIAAFFLISCSKMTKDESSSDLPLIKEVFSLKTTQVIEGRAFIPNTHSNSSLIFLQTKNVKGNKDLFDVALLLTSERQLNKIVFDSNSDIECNILDNQKVMVLHSKKGKTVHIIGTSDMDEEMKKVKSKLSAVGYEVKMTNSGFGLSLMKGGWNRSLIEASQYKNAFNLLDVADIKNANKVNKIVTNAEDDDDNSQLCVLGSCTSGGAGSTSCSLTEPTNGCTVTCTTGYYACCNSTTVRCYCCKIQ